MSNIKKLILGMAIAVSMFFAGTAAAGVNIFLGGPGYWGGGWYGPGPYWGTRYWGGGPCWGHPGYWGRGPYWGGPRYWGPGYYHRW